MLVQAIYANERARYWDLGENIAVKTCVFCVSFQLVLRGLIKI